MSEQNNIEIFMKIEEETKKCLNGNNLKIALDLLAYLNRSGMTPTFPNGDWPKFYYLDKLVCLFVYLKSPMDQAILNGSHQKIEKSDSEQSSSWNFCCWQCGIDIYEPEKFPLDESFKKFAQDNVWKCVNCGGCGAPGIGRRTVFGKEYNNVCVHNFQFTNPNNKILEKIIHLMDLQKFIISDGKSAK